LEEKERQIELQIQKEAKFLASKAIAGQPPEYVKQKGFYFIKLLTNKAMLLRLPSYRRCQQAFSFSIDFSRFCIELN